MIIRAAIVAPIDREPVHNGAVAIQGDRIIDVAAFSKVAARHRGPVTDLGDRVLLPGLINSHCHLDYSCLRGRIPQPGSFTSWIESINRAKADLSADDYVCSMADGFAELKRFGTTTVVNITAFPALISELTAPIRVHWFGELIDVREPSRADYIAQKAVETLQQTRDMAWGLAPHAPFTASAALYRKCEELAPKITTHVAESAEEMGMFREAAGPLYDFLKSLGRDMSDCGGTTPLREFVERVGERGLTKTIVAHLNEVTDEDFNLLAQYGNRLTVAHCPRSHRYFRHSPFGFGRMRNVGVNVCLGTDSLASNDDLSLFAEMREFQAQFPDVAPADILKMVTVNAARALGAGGSLGAIGVGGYADLIAVPYLGADIFSEILAFTEQPWRMISGQAVE